MPAMPSSMLQNAKLQRPFAPVGGHAFTAEIPAELRARLAAGSLAVVVEDGAALGPAGTLHQHIREYGRGAFSVWGSHVYLSASDNSDCNQNGRAYTLQLIDVTDASLRDELARNDAMLLDLVQRNRNQNNSVVNNFFSTFQVLKNRLAGHGIPLPRRALELGSGKRPYMAMRCLAEGAELFVVNDVQRIERTQPAALMTQLVQMLEMFDLAAAQRLQSLLEPIAGTTEVRVRGLEVADERPFETLDGPGDLDLVFSTSVLEHVQRPREVLARMFELLRPGGHVWHSIDLRDHTDFVRPLDFLRLTTAQYAAIQTENRLRASEWDVLFRDAGFECIDRGYSAIPSGTTDGSNHRLEHTTAPPSRPWVDAAMRSGFQERFATMDLVDLSTLGMTFLGRKPCQPA